MKFFFLISLLGPMTAAGPLVSIWEGHRDEVTAGTFFPDGKRVLSVSADRTLKVWDVRTGEVLSTWEAQTEDLSAAVITPDAAEAVTAGLGHTLQVWDTATGKELASLKGHRDTVRTIALSPDGRTAATVTYVGVLTLWDLRARKQLAVLQEGPLANTLSAAFSPDGKTLVTGRWDKSLWLWDVPTRQRRSVWKGHKNKVTAVAFSPDGTQVLSGSRDNTLRLWDAASGGTLAVWEGHSSPINAVAFSPDGTKALSGGRDTDVRLWEVTTGRTLAVWEGHSDHVNSVVFSPNGSLALSASHDQTLRLWSVGGAGTFAAKMEGEEDVAAATPEDLGRMLFFDRRLSGDESRDCTSCHIPEKAFTDGRDLALSYLDTLYFRNTPTLLNASQQSELYWDGRFPGSDLPAMLRDHIAEAHFLNADGRLVVEKLRQTPAYVRAFGTAYGTEPTYGGVLDALSAFLGSLRSGEPQALSPAALRGQALFQGQAGCVKCHSGPLYSDGKFHDRRVPENPKIYQDPLRIISFRRFFKMLGVEGYTDLLQDIGLQAITKEVNDRGRFRTPSLREAARTAPYMHNGLFATLEEAVAFEGPHLTQDQRADITAFLRSLSSEPPAIQVPPVSRYALRPRLEKKPTRVPARPRSSADLPPFPELGPLPAVPIPADNPLTPKKIELGTLLFFDQRVSGNAETYCVTCHEPAMGWGDGSALSQGYEGTLHWRNAQTLLNAAFFTKLNWDGSKSSLEEQARSAILSNISGNGDPVMIEERLAEVPEYIVRFKEVFGVERPHFEGVVKAIASFVRAVPLSRNVPFDAYAKGDKAALSPAARRGMKVFKGKAGCIRCHNGPLVSDQEFHATGVPQPKAFAEIPLRQVAIRYEHVLHGVPEEVFRDADSDPGLYLTTLREEDIGKFRTPSLRELHVTAPYMHNGAFRTLPEVVEFYDKGGGPAPNKDPLLEPLGLTPLEKTDLIAFLLSLSGDEIITPTPIEAGEHYTTTGYQPGKH